MKNPIIKGDYADPGAAVFNGKLYIYPTTENATWNASVFKAFSSANMQEWNDEGIILDLANVPWTGGVRAWAPAICEKNGKYYFYYSGNSWLMQKILKDEWNFEGVVISDFDAIREIIDHGVAKDRKEAAKLAFGNNCDIEMCSTTYFGHLQELIEEGTIPMERLDRAVSRVLELKDKLGLFEDPYRGASETEESEVFLTEENREVSRNAATECAVLLKNNGVLPFSKDIRKIALIGPFADNHKIIGFWACNGRNEESVTVYEGIKKLLPDCEIELVKGCGDEWNV